MYMHSVMILTLKINEIYVEHFILLSYIKVLSPIELKSDSTLLDGDKGKNQLGFIYHLVQ